MARGRWQHTAQILAMLLNVNRAKSSSPIATGDEWNPYAAAEAAPERTKVSPKEFVAALAAACGKPIQP